MPSNGPKSKQPAGLQRLVFPVGIALAAGLFVLGTALVFRTQLVAYAISSSLREAGLKDVSLTVERLGMGALAVDDLTAEGGALRIPRIEAAFTLTGLLRARLETLTIAGMIATITWDQTGVRLGEFRPNPDSGPLTLPEIGILRAEEMTLVIDTPAASFRAPLAVTARAVPSGWDAAVNGSLEGPGVTVALGWTGVIFPRDLSQSTGQGRFDIAVDDFLVPGSNRQLDAEGLFTLDARDGVFALSVTKPLTFSAAATPSGSATALADLAALPWRITIAPSQSQAALVFSSSGERRDVRFDIAAAGEAGDGRLNMTLVGEAARSPQQTAFNLSRAHADLARLPFSGGEVSGRITVSNLAGTTEIAAGVVEASLEATKVRFSDASLDDAKASLASTVSISDGVLRFDFKSLRLMLSQARLSEWILATPAEVALKPGGDQAQSITIGSFALSNSAQFALALPELALVDADDQTAQLLLRAPDIRLAATSTGLSLSASLAASDLSFNHPAVEMRGGRFDLKMGGGDASGTMSTRFTRIGPATEGAVSSSALVTSASLSTRGDDLVVQGTFSTAGGAKLGDYRALVSPDFTRGSATLAMPKTRFERGGKFDAAELAFIAPVSDLTGAIGFDFERKWTPSRVDERAQVNVEDVSFLLGDVSVTGLTTTIELAALVPPRSEATLRLSSQSVTAGLSLAELSADYALPGDGTLLIKHASAGVAGGQLILADAAIPLDGRPGAFSVGIRNIDMAQLAAQAKVDGLTVTGTLTGSVPMLSNESGYHFADGILRADAPGRIVYAPSSPSSALSQNQGGALVLQTLSNFAYDRLSITLNGPLTDEISLLVAIAGKNPDLYGGYPIEFNLNLSGKLTQILRQGLVGAAIPADLERRLREGRPPGP